MQNKIVAKLAEIKLKVRARMSVPLPETDADMNKFVDEILTVTGYPIDNDSLRHAVLTQIMHLPQAKSTAKQITIVHAIKRALANQAAFNGIADIKERNEAKAKASKDNSDPTGQ